LGGGGVPQLTHSAEHAFYLLTKGTFYIKRDTKNKKSTITKLSVVQGKVMEGSSESRLTQIAIEHANQSE
jgi:hypothetical protein